MKFYIGKGDSKGFWTFDTEKSVSECEEYEFEGKYHQYLWLTIYLDDKQKLKIGKICMCCFDMATIELDGEDLVDIADSIDQDVYEAIDIVVAKEFLPENVLERPMLCYLETLYITPEFRGKGIGTWIVQNLHSLVPFYLKSQVYGFVTYPRPSDGHEADDVIENIIKTDPMYNHMERLLLKNGYKRIDKTNYFFKSYGEESD